MLVRFDLIIFRKTKIAKLERIIRFSNKAIDFSFSFDNKSNGFTGSFNFDHTSIVY